METNKKAETACPHHMTGPMNAGAPLFPHECGKPLRGVPTGRETAITAEQLAQLFHETYERLAPQFGYVTRKASAKPWADVPDQNKALMTAVCAEVAAHVREAAQRDVCQVCWTSSWEPCPEGTPNAVRNLGSKSTPWMVCGLCAAREQLEASDRKLAELEKVLREAIGFYFARSVDHSPRCECWRCRAEVALASLRAESKEPVD